MPDGSNILPATIGLVGVLAGSAISWLVQSYLMGRRIDADIRLAEKRFEFDRDLAERKVALELELADQKKKIELAEEVLTAFYEVRDIVSASRSPMSYVGEGRTRQRSANESEQLAGQRDTYYAVAERLDRKQETLASLMSKRHRMVAWFGSEALAPFDKLNKMIVRVSVSVRMLIMTSALSGPEVDLTLKRKWEADIWALGDENDEISSGINEAVSAIESICKPVLLRKQR